MLPGLSVGTFTLLHVLISLAGIVSGIAVVRGMLASDRMPRWTAGFLATTGLTSLTGFPLPPFGIDPPRVIGVILLVLLAVAVLGYYGFRLRGAWRWIYAVTAIIALYLNVFMFIVQAFQKVFFLNALAPTQSELPFVIVQAVALIGFAVFGFLAVRSFRPKAAGASLVT